MAGDALQQILDEMGRRVRAELDAQLEAVRAREAETIALARREAENVADHRWATRLEEVLEPAARLSLEHRSPPASSGGRPHADRGPHGAQPAGVGVLDAVRALDAACSLSGALDTLARSAATYAPRAVLFIVNGTRFEEWPVAGTPAMSSGPLDLAESGLLRSAVARGTPVLSPADGLPPSCALLPPECAALAVPLMAGGRAIAVLYADERAAAAGPEPSGWTGPVELLARHAGACLAHLTALRSLQLLRTETGTGPDRPVAQAPDDEQVTRRSAKPLVSEIK